MIYLVSGIDRSGTSMMTACMGAGLGLPIVYEKERDFALNFLYGVSDYIPNPHGFYQFPMGEIERSDFIDEYDNCVLKCPWSYLYKLPPHQYKLVFMLRDPIEIRASMQAFTPYQSWKRGEVATFLYTEIIQAINSRVQQRGDTTVITAQFSQVIDKPIVRFTAIKSGLSLSTFDIQAAVALVVPELYRFRLESI